jgi:pimeloyl-ACP methyl ester carboxylesterase
VTKPSRAAAAACVSGVTADGVQHPVQQDAGLPELFLPDVAPSASAQAGLAVWMLFKEWTHDADVPEDAVDRDQLLTNVMLYWLTGTANSSARMYHESMHAGFSPQQPATTPTGVAVFAEDYAIRRYGERGNNIVHWTEFDRGGHFAAMEVPDLLVGDVRNFFRGLR